MRTTKKKSRHMFNHHEQKKGMKWFMILMAVFIASMVLAGCSSSSSSDSAKSTSEQMDSNANYATSADLALMDSKAVSYSESADKDTSAAEQTGAAPGSGSIAQVPTNESQKLIYNAHLVMEVKQYEAAKQRVNDIIHLAGGYALQFNDQFSDYERGGQFVFKVPSKGFQSVLDQLNQVENIRFERNYSAEDVTEEYVDLTSRLKARKVNEARLLAYMEKATNTNDLLALSQQLASEQEVIEQIVGRMRYIDNNVSMSTIDLRLYETIKSSPSSRLTATFGERIGSTLSGSLHSLQFIGEVFVIVFVALAPYLLIIALFAAPVVWLIRKYRKKHPAYPYNRHAQRNTDLLHNQQPVTDVITSIDENVDNEKDNEK